MNITRMRRWVKHGGAAGVLMAGMFLLLHALRRRRAMTAAAAGLLFMGIGLHMLRRHDQAAPYFITAHRAQAGPLRVAFLDVGKGDAIVIETPGGLTLVVDAGGTLRDGDDQANRVILPYLRSRGLHDIDALLLTHPHPDHVGGAATLIQRLPVGMLLDNGIESSLPAYRRYREAARERNVECLQMRRGSWLETSDGVRLIALAPPRTPQGNTNNTSIVLRLEYKRNVFLLTGDAEAESESEMLHSGQALACDVLKVGHHGGPQSSSTEFVAAAKPGIAVISVDADNRNGYPAPEVVERLQQIGATIYRTDQHGNITCLADGATIRVETARR
jgi:competence protein ComEC